MNSNDFNRVQHIILYCKYVENAIRRFGNDLETFLNDVDYQHSVAMSIMQIGELSIGLSDEFKNSTKEQMQWGLIRGMRNLLAHTYSQTEKPTIWEVATKDVPSLLQFCNRVVAEKNSRKNS